MFEQGERNNVIMKKSTLLGMILFLSILIGSVSVVQSAPPYVEQPDAPYYEGNPIELEAQRYAEYFKVSVEEASQRLKIQDQLGQIENELYQNESPSFAGMWIQHEPDFRLIIQSTLDNDAQLTSYFEKLDSPIVIEFRQVKTSLTTLENLQKEIGYQLENLNLLADSNINIYENQIELSVTNSKEFQEQLNEAKLELPEQVLIIEVARLIEPAVDIGGGRYLYGYGAGNCTSGFSVVNYYGTRGITTAAHCPNTISYSGTQLPLVAQYYWGSGDVQWHTAPGFNVTNNIYNGSWYHSITATKSRNNQALGTWIGKYGITTGGNAGTITSKWVQPSTPPGMNYTFMQATNYTALGDSGGPVFVGGTAYGTVVGTTSGGGLIYMAVDYLSGINVSILTSP